MRVVFATVAFAMGIDAPNILHWGSPPDIVTYLQNWKGWAAVNRCSVLH